MVLGPCVPSRALIFDRPKSLAPKVGGSQIFAIVIPQRRKCLSWANWALQIPFPLPIDSVSRKDITSPVLPFPRVSRSRVKLRKELLCGSSSRIVAYSRVVFVPWFDKIDQNILGPVTAFPLADLHGCP